MKTKLLQLVLLILFQWNKIRSENSLDFSRLIKTPVATNASTQPPSRYTCDINLKLLHRLVLEISHSQTWVSTPLTYRYNGVTKISHQSFMAEG